MRVRNKEYDKHGGEREIRKGVAGERKSVIELGGEERKQMWKEWENCLFLQASAYLSLFGLFVTFRTQWLQVQTSSNICTSQN